MAGSISTCRERRRRWTTDSSARDICTSNWWGVADADSIADLIHDGNDDPGIHAFVQYLPFAEGAVPNEAMTWSGLKNLFR